MHLSGNEASTLSEWRLHWKVLPPCVAGVMMAGVHLLSLGVMIGSVADNRRARPVNGGPRPPRTRAKSSVTPAAA